MTNFPIVGVFTTEGLNLYPKKEFKSLDEAVIIAYNDNQFQKHNIIFYENGLPFRVQYITSRGIVLRGILKETERTIQIT